MGMRQQGLVLMRHIEAENLSVARCDAIQIIYYDTDLNDFFFRNA
jgi:hypothetical protein